MNYRTGQDEAAVADALAIGLFLKANGSLSGPSEGIALRMMERQIDHEVELGVVIGKPGSNISRADAWKHVAGYAVALDITPHGKEERSLRKSCETYLGARPVAGDRRRNSRSGWAGVAARRQRRAAPAGEHESDDSRCRRADRVRLVLLHAYARATSS